MQAKQVPKEKITQQNIDAEKNKLRLLGAQRLPVQYSGVQVPQKYQGTAQQQATTEFLSTQGPLRASAGTGSQQLGHGPAVRPTPAQEEREYAIQSIEAKIPGIQDKDICESVIAAEKNNIRMQRKGKEGQGREIQQIGVMRPLPQKTGTASVGTATVQTILP